MLNIVPSRRRTKRAFPLELRWIKSFAKTCKMLHIDKHLWSGYARPV